MVAMLDDRPDVHRDVVKHELSAVITLIWLNHNLVYIMLNSSPRFFSGISSTVVVVGVERLFAMGFLSL
jgi:hypothetical protein